MTDRRAEAAACARVRSRCAPARSRRTAAGAALVAAAAVFSGCASSQDGLAAAERYYRYDFVGAREAVRDAADHRVDEDYLLNNLRLGVASMADGNIEETERALLRVFDLLSTAGLNKDRTVGAVLLYEGVRVWKGEPFEQALAYYWVGAHYATRGDWENARAAAANSLFRLTDFGRDMDARRLARRAAEDDAYLESGYTAVDTDFALGFLLQAIGADRTRPGAGDAAFDAVVRIDPSLGPVVETLRARAYDTLLLVDAGRGPQKIAYGEDNAFVRFVERDGVRGPLRVSVDGAVAGEFPVTCDVGRMAKDHRWNNLEDVRRAKSVLGSVLLIGGSTAAAIGASQDSGAAVAAGLGAVALGLLLKASAQADTRHLEMAPAAIYVVPLRLGRTADLELAPTGDPSSTIVLPGFRPGTERAPRAVYLRPLGPTAPSPDWLRARQILYTNDHVEVAPGGVPWVLGGTDVGTPTRTRLDAYQAGGSLSGWTLGDLRDLYASLGIALGAGMGGPDEAARDASYRHVLEGGTGLFTPQPDSLGYKRIMFRPALVAPPAAPPASARSSP